MKELICSGCGSVVHEISGKAGFYCYECEAFVDCEYSEPTFVVKDSGEREDYDTGARRDTQEGKPRYDLISIHMLTRLANHMELGAKKYGEHNWQKGMPTSRLYASALRHLIQAADPDADHSEDHLAAAIFNIQAMIHMVEEVKKGRLPETLIDKEIQ